MINFEPLSLFNGFPIFVYSSNFKSDFLSNKVFCKNKIIKSYRLAIIFLFLLTFFIEILSAQVSQFPQIYFNGQGIGGSSLLVRPSPSLSSTALTSLSVTSKIGAESYTTSSESQGTGSWAKVCLPSTTGDILYGYMLYGEYYIRVAEINNYATVTASSLFIRPCAGCTTLNVTIGGQNALYGQNSIVALTGSTSNVSGTIWYAVYLTTDCSQSTGWLSGDFLSLNNNPTNYYNVAGTIKNNSNQVIWGSDISIGSWTTNSSEGFYQYKVPIGWSGTITSSHPDYDTSTPTSYSHTANNHNYTRNFILSNSGPCTAVNITSHPQNQSANVGSTATFNVGVGGTAPFLYFWYKNGVQIQGESNAPYTTPVLSSLDNGNTYYCIIYNCDNSYQAISNTVTLTVVSNCSTPSTPPNPAGISPQCGSVTITRSGSVPSNVTWYWQNTSCGTSTNFGSGSTFTATSSGTYYIKARNNTDGCWSSGCGSVTVTVHPSPSNPGTPNVSAPQNGEVTLTRSGNPPSGVTWYWQGNSCSTNTSFDSGTPYTVSESGVYFIRARNNSTGCWSLGCGSKSVTISNPCTPPPTPGILSSTPPQTVSVTITRAGNPPVGVTWYWQGITCGTSTALGSGQTFIATESGDYYLRARNNATGCWSAECTSIPVIVNAATISVNNQMSVIPPWQREGDLLEGSVTVDLSNAGPNPVWFLQVDYFDENNNYIHRIEYPQRSSNITTQYFSTKDDPELYAEAKAGRHFKWNAKLVSNGTYATANQVTNILEKNGILRTLSILMNLMERIKLEYLSSLIAMIKLLIFLFPEREVFPLKYPFLLVTLKD
jgi:hypothetical protein